MLRHLRLLNSIEGTKRECEDERRALAVDRQRVLQLQAEMTRESNILRQHMEGEKEQLAHQKMMLANNKTEWEEQYKREQRQLESLKVNHPLCCTLPASDTVRCVPQEMAERIRTQAMGELETAKKEKADLLMQMVRLLIGLA